MSSTPFYAGSTIPFEWVNDRDTENIVIDLVKEPLTVVTRFAYPAKPDCKLLTKNGYNYNGVVEDVDTKDIVAGKLSLHVKEFVNDTFSPIGIIPIAAVIQTTVSDVEKW
jgi:hypothetical protein